MKITVITSTLNCAADLELTASSIRSQVGVDVQWIVADGVSTDGTVDVIQRQADIVDRWFSERDSGVYDAWNRACRFIEGDWVIFLGAGDVLHERTTLKECSVELAKVDCDVEIAYGGVIICEDGRPLLYRGKVEPPSLTGEFPALPYHQGVFHRANLLSGDRPFDITYRVVADSKLLLEALKRNPFFYMDRVISHMGIWGLSSHPRHAVRVAGEFFRLARETGMPIRNSRKIRMWTVAQAKWIAVVVLGFKCVRKVFLFKWRNF